MHNIFGKLQFTMLKQFILVNFGLSMHLFFMPPHLLKSWLFSWHPTYSMNPVYLILKSMSKGPFHLKGIFSNHQRFFKLLRHQSTQSYTQAPIVGHYSLPKSQIKVNTHICIQLGIHLGKQSTQSYTQTPIVGHFLLPKPQIKVNTHVYIQLGIHFSLKFKCITYWRNV